MTHTRGPHESFFDSWGGYRVSASDDRRGNRENWPRPAGLRRKSGHTSFSPLTVDPPQPSGPASSGPIFTRNAIHPSSVNRP